MQATSKNAILYTVRELGRRAGVAPESIARWKVRFLADRIHVFPEADAAVRIVFPYDPSKPARFAKLRAAPPGRYGWMLPPTSALIETIPDFTVLFSDDAGGGPLFSGIGPGEMHCNADILTPTLWMLSRMEEAAPKPADAHGRFPASESAAFRGNCLDRPIVDEYALALRQALSHLLPGWVPLQRQLKLKLSHDIDLVGLPRSFRSTVGHVYPRRIPGAFVRDSLSGLGIGVPAYLRAVIETARISRERGFDSAFYWKAAPRTRWDSGYDPEHPVVRAVIDRLLEDGFEMGVHPAYGTFDAPEQLEAEISRLRRVLGTGPLGGRQHFLRWRPFTWRSWEKAGLAYDSTVGFADVIGYRAGTAVPYHPWLLEEDRESGLLEIPLLVMDCTLTEYMKIPAAEAIARVAGLIRRSRATGGVFTLLWHNSGVIERPYTSLYPRLLNLFQSDGRYDWKADLHLLPLPEIRENGAGA
ncbi:MAG TPA: polysaccharide deacetylase family protein [Candidatus Solibacter sp.]|nr:polysaccharide deacetylase family protein [Candidatus Solibacter sp.]